MKLLLGIATLFAIGCGKGGIPGPVVTVPIHHTDIEGEKIHYGIPFQVLTKLDSLTSEIRGRDSVLAATLEDLRRPRKFQWQWDVKKDSTAIYGMAVLDWCPENGLLVHAVTVDSIWTGGAGPR